MSKAIVSVKKRIVRSEWEFGQQCPLLWICALGAVFAIHSETPLFESHVLAGNVLIALGVPIVVFVTLKLIRPLSYLMMNRSKKYDFVDDIKDPSLGPERLPAMAKYHSENERTWELSGTRGDLILSLVLYTFVIFLSFAYQSSVYFYFALSLSACLIASAIFCFVRHIASGKDGDVQSLSQQPSNNEERTTDSEVQDSFVTWIINRSTNAQFRFSRVWLAAQLFNVGMWVALVLVIPLIGPLFSEMFTLAICVGILCLFVLEMCSLFVFGYVAKRLFGHV